MKKILFFLLLSSYALAQSSQEKIEGIARNYFESNYVQNNFKDPYSYELKKIWSEPITKEENLRSSINSAELVANNKNVPKSMREDWKKKKDSLTAEYSKLSTDEGKMIVGYRVYFDTYAANSYGNKVLGRYKLLVDTVGKTIGAVESVN